MSELIEVAKNQREGTLVKKVNDYTALRAYEPTIDKETVMVLGGDAFGDVNAGSFRYDSASILADDGVNTIVTTGGARWRRVTLNYASAAQGSKADSALQPAANISQLTNDLGFITAAGAPVQSVNGQTGDITLAAENSMVFASTFGPTGDGATDDTAALQAAVTAAAGRILYVEAPAVEYLTGQLLIPSNTTIIFEPGVVLRKKVDGLRVLYLNDVENVVIHGNGAWIYGDDLPGAVTFSHTVLLTGAKKCVISNLNVDGASAGGAGKDCFYLGLGSGPCEDIHIFGGKALNSKRNGISIVAAKRTIIDGMEVAFATGAPGAGIDIEANFYDQCIDTLIQNCHVHDNQNAGIVSIFGPRTTIRDCEIHDNGTYGIGVSSGGAEFNEGVYRPNIDLWGVAAFDTVTGKVTLGGDLRNLPVGTPVNFQTRNGATKPAEFSASYYVISRHVSPDAVILGTSVGKGEITSLAGTGTGTLNADPDLSDIRLRAFVAGQSDNYILEGNKIYDNGTQGIFITGSGYHTIKRNTVWNNLGNQIQVQFTRNIDISDNYVYQTTDQTANVSGITASLSGGNLLIAGNTVENTRAKGISVAEWTSARVEKNNIWNCGFADPSSGKAGIYAADIRRPQISRNTVRQSESNATTLYGIRLEGTATDGTLRDNDCTGAGTTNANSFSITSATNSVENNTLLDGTRHLTGSATYDPVSLADGEGVTTTVPVVGAALGDFSEVAFNQNLNGITVTSYVLNGAVAVRFQNESGGVIDLASGTIKARVRR